MESVLIGFVEIIEEENQIYKDILDISRRKTQIIVDGKVSKLDHLTKTEQQMVVTIGRLEEEREEVIRKIAVHTGVERERIDMDFLKNRLNERLRDKFSKVLEEISLTLDELKKLNDFNSELIKKSLEYINFSINLIADNSSRHIYSNGKGKDEKEGVSFFDQKV